MLCIWMDEWVKGEGFKQWDWFTTLERRLCRPISVPTVLDEAVVSMWHRKIEKPITEMYIKVPKQIKLALNPKPVSFRNHTANGVVSRSPNRNLSYIGPVRWVFPSIFEAVVSLLALYLVWSPTIEASCLFCTLLYGPLIISEVTVTDSSFQVIAD